MNLPLRIRFMPMIKKTPLNYSIIFAIDNIQIKFMCKTQMILILIDASAFSIKSLISLFSHPIS